MYTHDKEGIAKHREKLRHYREMLELPMSLGPAVSARGGGERNATGRSQASAHDDHGLSAPGSTSTEEEEDAALTDDWAQEWQQIYESILAGTTKTAI